MTNEKTVAACAIAEQEAVSAYEAAGIAFAADPTNDDLIAAYKEAGRARFEAMRVCMAAELVVAGEKAEADRDDLVATFRKLGITSVSIDFYGSGDEGSIEDVTFTPADVADEALKQDVTDWAYSFLDATGIDWYNNDGGGGTISFDLTAGLFTYHIDVNEMTSETAESGEEVI
jgi:hypothetical protein